MTRPNTSVVAPTVDNMTDPMPLADCIAELRGQFEQTRNAERES